MDNLIFSHAEQKLLPLSSPTKGNITEWMEEQIQQLCQDNVILFNNKYYCHINLDEFISDMNRTYHFDLSELFDQYQSELWKVVLQRSQNLTELLKARKLL